jgi:GT2 family glycosyltransferase
MSHRKNKDRNKVSVAGFPAVDVVIPAYGCFDLLHSCLDALPAAADKIPLNVVVVDDAYPDADGLKIVVADMPYHITAVRNHENSGFGVTCNRGARIGGSEFILFLNTDVELLPFSIFLMVEAMKADPTIAVIGPKLLFPEDSGDPGRPAGKVQHAGMEINIRGEPFHIFVGWDRNSPKVNNPRSVPAVTGAAFLTRRADFKEVEGFDPIWGMGTYEDVDYCYRQTIRGKKIVYLPQAEGYHGVGSSAIAANKPYPLQQNLAVFKARWGGALRWTEWDVW